MTTKERPILFSGPMVKAILAGTKTQTRRLVIPRQSNPKIGPLHMEPWIIGDYQEVYDDGRPLWTGTHPDYPTGSKWFACDYGQPGERLWVRETLYEKDGQWFYRADDAPVMVTKENRSAMIVWAHHKEGSHCPSIHMPRWASRLTLLIKDIRPERLQDISEADAKAEGIAKNWIGADCPPEYENEWCNYDPRDADGFPCFNPRDSFTTLWDSINAKRGYSWENNPWVWRIEFEKP